MAHLRRHSDKPGADVNEHVMPFSLAVKGFQQCNQPASPQPERSTPEFGAANLGEPVQHVVFAAIRWMAAQVERRLVIGLDDLP